MYFQNTWSRFRVISVGVRIFKYFSFYFMFSVVWLCLSGMSYFLDPLIIILHLIVYIYILNVSHTRIFLKMIFFRQQILKPLYESNWRNSIKTNGMHEFINGVHASENGAI